MQTPRDGMLDPSDTYTLYLAVTVPASSGLPSSALASPEAILGRYDGFCFDSEAPLWTSMRPVLLQFRQPRGAMAELFRGLAIWAENLAIVGDILIVRSRFYSILGTICSLIYLSKCSSGLEQWRYVFICPLTYNNAVTILQTGTPAESRVQTPLTPQMLPPADRALFRRRTGRRR
jgi:hypothetical protein